MMSGHTVTLLGVNEDQTAELSISFADGEYTATLSLYPTRTTAHRQRVTGDGSQVQVAAKPGTWRQSTFDRWVKTQRTLLSTGKYRKSVAALTDSLVTYDDE